MSTNHRTITELVCDKCSAILDTESTDATDATSLRLRANRRGWRYVKAMVPRPIVGHGQHKMVPRTWDFCGDCGVPDELPTQIQASVNRGHSVDEEMLPLTIKTAVAVYGGE